MSFLIGEADRQGNDNGTVSNREMSRLEGATKAEKKLLQRIAADLEFGDAGKQLVVEERLVGQEASVLAITDGRTIVTMPADVAGSPIARERVDSTSRWRK